jgi:hypothetical protein
MAVAKEKKICNNKKNVFNWQEFVTAELGKNLEWILAMNGLKEEKWKMQREPWSGIVRSFVGFNPHPSNDCHILWSKINKDIRSNVTDS